MKKKLFSHDKTFFFLAPKPEIADAKKTPFIMIKPFFPRKIETFKEPFFFFENQGWQPGYMYSELKLVTPKYYVKSCQLLFSV